MKLFIILGIALLSAAPAVHAQGPAAPLPLTLEDAIARGLAASHRLKEAAALAAAADASADARHAARLPQVAAQAGYTRTNHVEAFGVLRPNGQLRNIYPDIPDNWRARLDAQWLIWDGGRAHSLERAAQVEARAHAADVEVARAEARLDIARAYWSLVTAIESTRIVDESVGRLDAHLRDVRNQLAAGLVAPNDVLNVEAQQSHQRMLSIQARSNRDVADAVLARLVGAPPGTSIAPVSLVNQARADVGASPTFDAIFREAQRTSPERHALAERLAAAGERQQAAAAAFKPTVGLAAGLDYARPNPRIFPREGSWQESWDASVNLQWPLFDGGRARAERAETAALTTVWRERLAELDAALAVEARQRVSERESSAAAIAAAEDGVRAAAESRRVAGERFDAGVATSTDVVDAQVALLQASLDRTQAMASARLAEARLARTIGQ